jgi:hypothetical protein
MATVMIFLSQLRHALVIERPTAVLDINGDPTYTEYGTQITEYVEVAHTRGLIQPRASTFAREVALLSQAGAVIGDHTIFMVAGEDLTTADRIAMDDEDDPRRWEVLAINDAGGQHFHIEVNARLISSSVEPAAPVGS